MGCTVPGQLTMCTDFDDFEDPDDGVWAAVRGAEATDDRAVGTFLGASVSAHPMRSAIEIAREDAVEIFIEFDIDMETSPDCYLRTVDTTAAEALT
jgi:hypothetical protein